MQTVKTTPLYEQHLSHSARMVPFGGYEMPLVYQNHKGGTKAEHLRVRESLGMFDVSHMGEFEISGSEATSFINWISTRQFETSENGRVRYGLMLNEKGGILDDILIYQFHSEKYWLVVNAATRFKDWKHLQEQAQDFSVTLSDVSEKTALIAVQGPRARESVVEIYPSLRELKRFRFVEEPNLGLASRTGYTGEDGFEIFLPAKKAPALWKELLKRDVWPIGLGARDTLRMEAGMPLYGQDLYEELRPHESLSAFAARRTTGFLGAQALEEAPRYRAVGLVGNSPKPFRAGEKLFYGKKCCGFLTSGSYSPCLHKGMGLAVLERSEETDQLAEGEVFVLESQKKPREAILKDPPLVEKRS